MTIHNGSAEDISAKLYRYDKIAGKLGSLQEIGEAAAADYSKQGFLAVENVLDERQIEAAIAALNDLMFVDAKGAHIQFTKPQGELNTLEEREQAIRKISRYVDADERLGAISRHPALMEVLERLLGDKPVLVQDMALLKPPQAGGEKPWHQDMAYGTLAYNRAVIGVWIALDEACLDNGCMHVIPGSHAEGAVPHYAMRDWQICDAHIPVERDVAVPLAPGGALLFHGLLKHGTPFNLSAKRRRALQLHYAAESALKLRPQEYKLIFTNAMTDAEC
ncbi:phytanoyl-CoA dioxygenase family protein [Paenibacillus sp. J5C_2022]|uniref:phytanoyl-CoA dioxygenase family protein n=1 Tax=Paenibacillus sp. J5C2022 TaxID=2977129 RepID=UPI0021D2896D|nr:phytanoyl-CoA dioxygenase family protein [Paenibacillus sp. J5C2022]MCU6710839.1 phytanoyl-CoA dioxygenase family protein [Paenibacillus sp. J5C2022]